MIRVSDRARARKRLEEAMWKIDRRVLDELGKYADVKWLSDEDCEAYIPILAEELSLQAFEAPREPTAETTRRLVKRVKQDTATLYRSLTSLRAPAFATIGFKKLPEFLELLNELHLAAATAKIPSPSRGARAKYRAKRVAEMAATCYASLTGRRPSRAKVSNGHNNFVMFLADVYAALEINASAESHAKNIVAQCRENSPR